MGWGAVFHLKCSTTEGRQSKEYTGTHLTNTYTQPTRYSGKCTDVTVRSCTISGPHHTATIINIGIHLSNSTPIPSQLYAHTQTYFQILLPLTHMQSPFPTPPSSPASVMSSSCSHCFNPRDSTHVPPTSQVAKCSVVYVHHVRM